MTSGTRAAGTLGRGDSVDHSTRLWTVLMLNLWHQRWIESPRPVAKASAAETVSA